MPIITLLRHGQASFGADNYDELSETGHKQSRWLGEHLKRLGKSYDRVLMGSMVRHRQTASGVIDGLTTSTAPEIYPGLNEYSFKGLLAPLKTQYPKAWIATGHARHDYYHNMKLALDYWMNADIADDGIDSWQSFCDRVLHSFQLAYKNSHAKRILVVTSGGPISVILAKILHLDKHRTRDITLQIKNSSISTLLYNGKSFSLDSFNDVSHLMTADKQNHITFS